MYTGEFADEFIWIRLIDKCLDPLVDEFVTIWDIFECKHLCANHQCDRTITVTASLHALHPSLAPARRQWHIRKIFRTHTHQHICGAMCVCVRVRSNTSHTGQSEVSTHITHGHTHTHIAMTKSSLAKCFTWLTSSNTLAQLCCARRSISKQWWCLSVCMHVCARITKYANVWLHAHARTHAAVAHGWPDLIITVRCTLAPRREFIKITL